METTNAPAANMWVPNVPVPPTNAVPTHLINNAVPVIATASTIDMKTILIIVLGGLLVIAILGVNVIDGIANVIKRLAEVFSELIAIVLKLLGYTTGAVVSTAGKSVEVVGRGVEVIGHGLERIGDGVEKVGDQVTDQVDGDHNNAKDSTKEDDSEKEPEFTDVTFPSSGRKIDEVVGRRRGEYNPGPIANDPMARDTVTGSKQRWCLAGSFRGTHGCTAVDDDRLCTSGRLFPSKSACMMPDYTTKSVIHRDSSKRSG